MELEVKNREGKTVDTLNLDDDLFNGEVNEHLIFLSVKGYLDNQRQGNAKTKTRGEVCGGGRKPWRQKGTGRARAGSNRSPIWRHGGIVFGPQPRSYYHQLTKNEKRLALLNAIANKIQKNGVVAIDELTLTNPKTKEAVSFLNQLGLTGNILLVTRDRNETALRAFANLPTVSLITSNELNTYAIVKNDVVVFEKDVFSEIQEGIVS